MSITVKILFYTCILAIIQGCNTFADFEDISSNSKYAGLVNKTYKTKIKFLVYGVNMDKTIGKDIHRYSIIPPPGIGGREIISRDSLEIGSTIKILKILRCTNCYLDFSPRIELQVKIMSSDKYSSHDVDFNIMRDDIEFVLIQNSAAIMNPKYFELHK